MINRIATLAQALQRARQREAILQSLFALQRAMVLDEERFLCAHPGRRGGKTWAIIAFLLLSAAWAPPDTLCPYISTSRKHAKRNVWGLIKRFDRALRLGLEYNATDLTATFPGGGGIWVTGCADESQVEDFLGNPYPAVAIDEAGSFPMYLDELVNRAILPALADFGGKLLIAGTPPPSPVGLFHRIISERSVAGWGTPHHWDMRDNPYMPSPAAEMESIRIKRGWSLDHPTFVREYLGKPVTDQALLVYHYHDGVLVEAIPVGKYRHVLGIDFGWSETRTTTAFSLLAYAIDRPVTYVVKTWARPAMAESEMAREIKRIDSDVGGLDAIVGDPGGFGRKYIDELMVRFGVPIQPAEKRDKRGFIQLLNGDLKTGKLRLVREGTRGLVGEWHVLPWKDQTRKEEKSGVPNHHSDATLYGWRHCFAFGFRPDEPSSQAESEEEYQRAEEARIIAGLEKQAKERKEEPWWRRKQGNSRAARMPRWRS